MIARMIPSGSTMNTARTVFVPLPGWINPSLCAIASVPAMIGNSISTFKLSLIQSIHLMWEKT